MKTVLYENIPVKLFSFRASDLVDTTEISEFLVQQPERCQEHEQEVSHMGPKQEILPAIPFEVRISLKRGCSWQMLHDSSVHHYKTQSDLVNLQPVHLDR